MTDHLLDILGSEVVRAATSDAERASAVTALGLTTVVRDQEGVRFSAHATEVAALRLHRSRDRVSAQMASRDAFDLLRAVLGGESIPQSGIDRARLITRTAAFGVLADIHAQTHQLLDELEGRLGPADNWAGRVELGMHRAWHLLIRRRSWADIDGIAAELASIRGSQADEEPSFLNSTSSANDAWTLVAHYHLLRSAEIIAEYTETGTVGGHFDPIEQAELHFDRAGEAAREGGDAELEFLAGLLDQTARALVAKSTWRVARGAGTRATAFVRHLTSRDNAQPYLELLPPQRRALIEDGLASTGRRSVVVSLPTSSGKTLIAEFRILQALDSYEAQSGWVAYTAPTRALVNQLTARLRRDLGPLGIRVERFSPALEVDSVEAEILASTGEPFRVVVTTPEKLDLLVRGGWVRGVRRPLSLVIVDEAHNLATSERGIRLELLLATINREVSEASFLLMTPFVPNASEIAAWLDPDNNASVELGLEWLPNDRVVGLAMLEPAAGRGESRLTAEPVLTSAASLYADQIVELATGRLLNLPYSSVRTQSNIAAATSSALSSRGTTVTIVHQPATSWSVADKLAGSGPADPPSGHLESVVRILDAEYGSDYPLGSLLTRGVAVHHAGLSDDLRSLVEVLAERGLLKHIVATTTLAQGINFPISNVVLATHMYPYGQVMPPEDFWNIAGRAGRANHGQPGVILLAAHDAQRASELRTYVQRSATKLTSTLLGMVESALARTGELDLSRLAFIGEWSSFVQFITHTLRQVGEGQFGLRVEQILRGTLGFQDLRANHPDEAELLVRSVRTYASQLGGQAIGLVDSTGFSWESVSATLGRLSTAGIGSQLLDRSLLASGSPALTDAIGIMLQVPELREQLLGPDTSGAQGDYLARLVKDWVAGAPLKDLAASYFATDNSGSARDKTEALTKCCQRLFGAILPTVSWGVSALQALTMARIDDDAVVPPDARDIPSFIYYGVSNRESVALRLSGVPRGAAAGLAAGFGAGLSTDELRARLAVSSPDEWERHLGPTGPSYYDAWRLVEPAA